MTNSVHASPLKRKREEGDEKQENDQNKKAKIIDIETVDELDSVQQKYALLQEEHAKLAKELATIKKVVREQEQTVQQSFSKLQNHNHKLIEQVKELTEKLNRAQQVSEQTVSVENKKVLELKKQVAQLEMERCDVERLSHIEKRENAALQRSKLEFKQLMKEKSVQEKYIKEKNEECESIQDLHGFLESFSGIQTEKATDGEDIMAYSCTCKSLTHVLKFKIESTEEGHALYSPLYFKSVASLANEESCWDELVDAKFKESFVIHGDLFPVFVAKLLATLWYKEMDKSFVQ